MYIEPDRLYSPKQIYREGFILNSKGKQDYFFILGLVNSGLLRSYPFGKATRVRRRVKGSDVIQYKIDRGEM